MTITRHNFSRLLVESRLDSVYSLATQMGIEGRDKNTSVKVRVDSRDRLSREVLEDLYYIDGISATIVDALPDDMFRKPPQFKTWNEELDRKIKAKIKKLALIPKCNQACKFAGLYGGGAIIIGANDGAKLSEHIKPETLRSIDYLNVVHKHQIREKERYQDPTAANYGEVKTYTLQGDDMHLHAAGTVIHHTRVIPFIGEELPRRIMERHESHNGLSFGGSVLVRAYAPLLNMLSTYGNVATLIHQVNQAVFQIQGFDELVGTEEGRAAIRERLRVMEFSRSNLNALILSDMEQFSQSSIDIRGLAELIDRFILHVSAVSHIPVTRLMGRSAAGMNATGEGDENAWYDYVAREQEWKLQEPLERLLYLLAITCKGSLLTPEEAEQLSVTFPALKELSEQEIADTNQKQATTDTMYSDRGLLTNREIRKRLASSANGTINLTYELDDDDMSSIMGEGEDLETEFGTADPLAGDDGGSVQDAAMNGAQVTSMVEVVRQVATGELPAESAIVMLPIAFPTITPEKARQLIEPAAMKEGVSEDEPLKPGEAPPQDPNAIPDGERHLPLKDVADQLGIGSTSIKKLATSGQIRYWRIGNRFRVLLSEVLKATQGNSGHAAPEQETIEEEQQ